MWSDFLSFTACFIISLLTVRGIFIPTPECKLAEDMCFSILFPVLSQSVRIPIEPSGSTACINPSALCIASKSCSVWWGGTVLTLYITVFRTRKAKLHRILLLDGFLCLIPVFPRGGNQHNRLPEDPAMWLHSLGFPSRCKDFRVGFIFPYKVNILVAVQSLSWVRLFATLKNWCFWTVVLEKTLESPLDCKEIQPVHPRGDESWVFIGRTDAEAEAPILWPPDVKSWLTWCWERLRAGGEGDDRGWDGWMASLTQWTWVWVDFESWWWTGRSGMLWFMGSQRVRHYWTAEMELFCSTPGFLVLHRQ